MDLRSKVNTIHPAYTIKLSLGTKKVNINEQKIDQSYLNTFRIVIADCMVKNK